MKKAKEINIDSKKQEITNNISGFPVACYYSEFSPSTYDYIDWHWHMEFQLCLTVCGTVVWGSESQQSPISAGEGIFINSQRVHMARPQDNHETAFFCVDIPPAFLCSDRGSSLYNHSVQPVLNDVGLQTKVIDNRTRAGTEILRILSDMSNTFDKKENGYEFELVSGVFALWKKLREFLENEIGQDTKKSDDRFREMLMFLQKHYHERVGLDEVVAQIGLSRSECCRYFKKHSGQTIFDYLMQYRIHKSMDMLTGTDHDIAQIAQDCGFSNQSYYTKRFKDLAGITPRQYRLQQKKDGQVPDDKQKVRQVRLYEQERF